jgi:hypothetical protein
LLKPSSNEDSVLYAIYQATLQLKKDCLNQQEISPFILPEARVGGLELSESVVDIGTQLMSKGALKECNPEVRYAAYMGYKLTDEGRKYAEKLQAVKVDWRM